MNLVILPHFTLRRYLTIPLLLVAAIFLVNRKWRQNAKDNLGAALWNTP